MVIGAAMEMKQKERERETRYNGGEGRVQGYVFKFSLLPVLEQR
jgi:hypothetical protein